MTGLQYRRGNINDIEQVFALNREVFDEAWSKPVMLQSLQLGYDLFVCHQGDMLQGYVLSQDVLLETQVMQLAVRHAARRQGVATALMRMLLHAKADAWLVSLEVRASNTVAQKFYQQLGFTAVARRKDYYAKTATKPREDAVLMQHKPERVI